MLSAPVHPRIGNLDAIVEGVGKAQLQKGPGNVAPRGGGQRRHRRAPLHLRAPFGNLDAAPDTGPCRICGERELTQVRPVLTPVRPVRRGRTKADSAVIGVSRETSSTSTVCRLKWTSVHAAELRRATAQEPRHWAALEPAARASAAAPDQSRGDGERAADHAAREPRQRAEVGKRTRSRRGLSVNTFGRRSGRCLVHTRCVSDPIAVAVGHDRRER